MHSKFAWLVNSDFKLTERAVVRYIPVGADWFNRKWVLFIPTAPESLGPEDALLPYGQKIHIESVRSFTDAAGTSAILLGSTRLPDGRIIQFAASYERDGVPKRLANHLRK